MVTNKNLEQSAAAFHFWTFIFVQFSKIKILCPKPKIFFGIIYYIKLLKKIMQYSKTMRSNVILVCEEYTINNGYYHTYEIRNAVWWQKLIHFNFNNKFRFTRKIKLINF